MELVFFFLAKLNLYDDLNERSKLFTSSERKSDIQLKILKKNVYRFVRKLHETVYSLI